MTTTEKEIVEKVIINLMSMDTSEEYIEYTKNLKDLINDLAHSYVNFGFELDKEKYHAYTHCLHAIEDKIERSLKK
jgi:hypothetical protein